MKKILSFCLIFIILLSACNSKKISPEAFEKDTKDCTKYLKTLKSGFISGTLSKTEKKKETKSYTETYFVKNKEVYTYTQSFRSDLGYSSIYTNGKDFWNFSGIKTDRKANFSKTPAFLTTLSSIISKNNIKSVTVTQKSGNKTYTVLAADDYIKKIYGDKKYTKAEYKYTLNSKGELIGYTLTVSNKREKSTTILNINSTISQNEALTKINEEKSKYRK